jgi:hypothetical protein
MRLTFLTGAALLTSVALAGTTAQAATQPGPRLAKHECHEVWKMASPHGDTLSRGKATPYVLNFAMVDANHNGMITSKEFKRGCMEGWVTTADASTAKDMKK